MKVFRNLDVKKIILIPSYNETESLKHFLSRLLPMCSKEVAVVICDDSEELARDYVRKIVENQIKQNECTIFVDFSEVKTGRCHAVVRGLTLAYGNFPNAEFFVECDADESHQVTDVMKILQDSRQTDFLIGSRYLPSSKIFRYHNNRCHKRLT
jgi:glycosyltransferase involved in cell wall biosynthesis